MQEYRKTDEAVAKLTSEQYRVTQEAGTEPAFRNEFWNRHDAGLYVDVVSGEPLFASVHKFDSGTGWPSFTVPVEPGNVVDKPDYSYGMVRTEVRSSHGDSHLGHVFPTGRGTRADCATASTRRHCGSCRSTGSMTRVTGSIGGCSSRRARPARFTPANLSRPSRRSRPTGLHGGRPTPERMARVRRDAPTLSA